MENESGLVSVSSEAKRLGLCPAWRETCDRAMLRSAISAMLNGDERETGGAASKKGHTSSIATTHLSLLTIIHW